MKGEMINLFSPLMILLPILFLFLFIIIRKMSSSIITSRPPLPPGPYPWPIIGNMFQIGKNPHIQLTKLAQLHGPLISLRMGKRALVVASSPPAASEILKTHDALLSGRNSTQTLPFEGSKFHKRGLVFSDQCDDAWRIIRNTYRKELFSAKALESQMNTREKKIREMIKFLGSKDGQLVRIRDVVFVTSLNLLSNAFLSVDIVDYDGNGLGARMMEQISQLGEVVASHQLLGGGWGSKSLSSKVHDIAAQVWAVWADILKVKRKNANIHLSGQTDFADILIAKGFSDEEINVMLQELYSAGTETTSSTIEWVMVELVKNKEAIQKLGSEIAQVINGDTYTVRESHLPHLPYLEACIKEVLRLHPAAPLLLPHRAVQTCQVMGYTIPKDSDIMVNVWAIARDPNIWDDPLSFKPMRFLGSDVDYKGQDFEYIPFGSGRRMCPGQPMASKTIPLIVASLIHNFDWFLPDNVNPNDIDMEEELDIAMHKKQPLCVVVKLREPCRSS